MPPLALDLVACHAHCQAVYEQSVRILRHIRRREPLFDASAEPGLCGVPQGSPLGCAIQYAISKTRVSGELVFTYLTIIVWL